MRPEDIRPQHRFARGPSGLIEPVDRGLYLLGGRQAVFIGAAGLAGGGGAPGVITQDARTTYNGTTAADPHTFNHTIGASADFLMVKWAWESARVISNVRCGGSGGPVMQLNAASKAVTGVNKSEIWWLDGPPTGTQQIWCDLDAPGAMIGEAVSLIGVDQTSPIVQADFVITASTNSATLGSALVPDGTCWCEVVGQDGNGTVLHTWGGGITETFDEDGGTFYGTGGFAADRTTNITPSFTLASGNGVLTISAMLLRAA